MHFHCEVYLKDKVDVEKQIETIMAPYYEGEGGDDSFWDWWVIGGRWTGIHDGYKPADDERNYEICYLCHGTGDRNYPLAGKELDDPRWVWYDIDNVRHFRDEGAEKCNGCNGCDGTGMKLKHPSDWVFHEGDVMEVSRIPDDLTCATLIVQNNIYQADIYHDFDMGSVKEFLNKLKITEGWLVTVDYHS